MSSTKRDSFSDELDLRIESRQGRSSRAGSSRGSRTTVNESAYLSLSSDNRPLTGVSDSESDIILGSPVTTSPHFPFDDTKQFNDNIVSPVISNGMLVVGVKQDTVNIQTKTSGIKFQKTIKVINTTDDLKQRPDVIRESRPPPPRDHEILDIKSLSVSRHTPSLEDSNGDSQGKLKPRALRPVRIDKYPNEEAKSAHIAHLSQLRQLRRYKYGISPAERIQLAAENSNGLASPPRSPKGNSRPSSPLGGGAPLPAPSGNDADTSYNVTTANSVASTGSSGIRVRVEMAAPPSPSLWENFLLPQQEPDISEIKMNAKSKKIFVKAIPEEKLGYYRRVNAAHSVTPAKDSSGSSENRLTSTSPEQSEGNDAQIPTRRSELYNLTAPPSPVLEAMARDPMANNPLQRDR